MKYNPDGIAVHPDGKQLKTEIHMPNYKKMKIKIRIQYQKVWINQGLLAGFFAILSPLMMEPTVVSFKLPSIPDTINLIKNIGGFNG